MLKIQRTISVVFVYLISNGSFADDHLLKTQQAQQFIATMVRDHAFSRQDVVASLRAATYQPQIIQSMERPYEKKPWDIYQAIFLTPNRLKEGVHFWQVNQATLAQAEKKFGVPASIIVAIVGVETLYGQHQGDYRVLDALTTLAFYYPKRAEFFSRELKEYLLLCREHHVTPLLYKGSYAGAMGKPQFMPSSYRAYAVRWSGKGRPDLIADDRDVIGSVANYVHKHGWKMNDGVAEPARLPAQKLHDFTPNHKYANYEYQRFLRAGLVTRHGTLKPPAKVGLIELTTQWGEVYWVAYPNFYVITRYNSSPSYALVVYLLAQQLKHQWAKQTVNPHGIAA